MTTTIDGTLGVSKVSDDAITDQGLYDKENILGVVSETLGVPTGAIIEQGSNANGEYTKFADGTMIARSNPLLGSVAISTAWGAIYISVNYPLGSMPVTFVGVPNTSFIPSAGSALAQLSKLGLSGTATWGTVTFSRGTATTVTGLAISCIAIGRWS